MDHLIIGGEVEKIFEKKIVSETRGKIGCFALVKKKVVCFKTYGNFFFHFC